MQDLSHFGTQIAEKLQLLSSSSAHRIPRHASSDSTRVLAELPPASISSCKLTRDASKDSWFSGRRRISAVELRLHKLSRREGRRIPRPAAHSNASCAHPASSDSTRVLAE